MDMSAIDFDSVETLCVVDAVDNPRGAPLSCDPPHTIANDLGVQEYNDYAKGADHTAQFKLDVGTPENSL